MKLTNLLAGLALVSPAGWSFEHRADSTKGPPPSKVIELPPAPLPSALPLLFAQRSGTENEHFRQMPVMTEMPHAALQGHAKNLKNEQTHWKDVVKIIGNPEKTKGILHVGNLYFSSPRTWESYKNTFQRTLSRIPENLANSWAQTEMDFIKASKPTIMALNDPKDFNQCQDVLTQMSRLGPGTIKHKAPHLGGSATVPHFFGKFVTICWDDKHLFSCSAPANDEMVVFHEKGHRKNMLDSTMNTYLRKYTPHLEYGDREEELVILRDENPLRESLGYPIRTDHACNVTHPTWGLADNTPVTLMPISNSSSLLDGKVHPDFAESVAQMSQAQFTLIDSAREGFLRNKQVIAVVAGLGSWAAVELFANAENHVQHQVSEEKQNGEKQLGTVPPQAQSVQQLKNLQQVMQDGLESGRTYGTVGRGVVASSRVK